MPTPVWYQPSGREALAQSTPRHQWMCEQLLARRRLQAAGESVLPWLQAAIQKSVGPQMTPTRVFEVLSDGLGYLEPNWHAIDFGPAQPSGSSAAAQVAALRERIRVAREKHRESLSGFPTQRALGGRLYESGLFLVAPQNSYFLAGGAWQEVSKSVLPLKFESDGTNPESERRTIDASLRLLSQQVLWPSFFENSKGSYLSLVFLHTSLWQSVAGVWAFHARCDGDFQVPSIADEARLRQLVEPAIRCLEDVVGWANEHEGSHAGRRRNVDLFFRATGRLEPEWTPDGVRGLFEEHDRRVYEISPSPSEASDAREIFDRALDLLADRSGVHKPASAADHLASAILRCLQGLFVAGRLAEQTSNPPTTQQAQLPPLSKITLDYVARECRMAAPFLPAEYPSDDPEGLAKTIAKAVPVLTDPEWRSWCSVAFRLLCLAGFAGRDVLNLATVTTDERELVMTVAGEESAQ